ncbi:phosphate ABC transporter permease PstA [Halorubrum ezzemoulense]|uniref:Phosphate transport system permease protein PstA n=2 Tax=Halorubrum ezzemoulense TaxID=337243 RepID=A0A256K3S6_HALEZ|nr:MULTISPECIES: phosphate ABC transporter permease PstA [Halorubrum]MDB2237777.1 phosphate ABC transporter permease PstA [Halorubrum ezzemoulense]MDB2243498.1 phosphate ABC transporter permease PstA [Halorubrum ezzemoulense]MDB2248729.1 phosphate ABC transporter permease PstA [Halorubrum ezzemoulense]MDB2251564.1 phosphate ABC transporter permease PstA [Halorubrum ezzemoulense]MDB2277234.1 phosphate ABC transporter permease PstA [Halorubrum ezzemoulense]
MADASQTDARLVESETTETDAVAGVAVGLSAVLFALAVAALFERVSLTGSLFGIRTVTLLGGLLTALGVAVVAFGAGSRLGYVETDPDPSAGLVAGFGAAVPWVVVGGSVASQTLGLGTTVGVLAGTAVGGGAFALTVLPREDVGSTLPLGSLLALTGLVFLTGVIGPTWVWELDWAQQAALTAEFLIPAATLFSALYGGWASAKAYGGFGARGRHMGAYVLVYLNALSIVAFLFVLVAFVVVQGVPGLLNGVEIGLGTGPQTTVLGVSVTLPVSVPFVMNGVALFNDFQGVLPAIVGTVWLVLGAVVLAVPLGVGAALFLTEYADRGRFTQVVEIATNGLWSTPSIVFGLFGFAFLIPRFGNGKSLLSGMITLGFMLLPLVVITSREAMLSVPDEYRDASAALGVSKWQTIRSVVLPAALPGVVTGVILGVGRIAGETAPILLTMAGGTFVPGSQTVDVLGSFQFTSAPPFVANPALLEATSALPYQLYALISAGVGASSNVGNADEFRWATALVLLVVVLSFYAIGIATRYYFRRRLTHT